MRKKRRVMRGMRERMSRMRRKMMMMMMMRRRRQTLTRQQSITAMQSMPGTVTASGLSKHQVNTAIPTKMHPRGRDANAHPRGTTRPKRDATGHPSATPLWIPNERVDRLLARMGGTPLAIVPRDQQHWVTWKISRRSWSSLKALQPPSSPPQH
jgi:hypothetical protein